MARALLLLAALALILAVSGCTQAPAAPTSPEPAPIQPAPGPQRIPEPVPEPPQPAPVAPASGPPLKIKSLPLAISPLSAGRAGDLVFTQQKLELDRILIDYGFVIPANSAGPAKTNPQPTFIAPLGTKVRSLVDGIVVAMPTLWSNDLSIHVAADENSRYRYETEHIINPLVKIGDRVTAGQVIAEVSDYDSRNTPGYGLVEIGILFGGRQPEHLCPFQYLDPAINQSVQQDLLAFYEAWNQYRGEALYNLSAYAV
ncbi:MAG TPA: M23 family metallopeptidase, partial [archaeon]|nr:M23 family metallopeptidase [archaeon]